MSKSKQQSTQRSQSSSFVDPNQVAFLGDLRSQAQNLAGSQSQNIGGVAQQLSGQLGGAGGEFLGGLLGSAGGFAPGAATAISRLQGIGQGQGGINQAIAGIAAQNPTQGALDALIQRGAGVDFNQLLQPGQQLEGQLGALDEAIQRNLASTLGTVGGQASVAGQAGGGREAFFASEAAGDAQRAFASGASDLLGSDLAARRGLAGTAAQLELGQRGQLLGAGQLGLAQQGQQAGILQQLLGTQVGAAQAGGQLGLAQQAGNVQAGLGGLGSLSSLFNLGLAPFQAEFAPLQALAGIVGPATVLSQQTGQGQSSGSSFGLSVG